MIQSALNRLGGLLEVDGLQAGQTAPKWVCLAGIAFPSQQPFRGATGIKFCSSRPSKQLGKTLVNREIGALNNGGTSGVYANEYSPNWGPIVSSNNFTGNGREFPDRFSCSGNTFSYPCDGGPAPGYPAWGPCGSGQIFSKAHGAIFSANTLYGSNTTGSYLACDTTIKQGASLPGIGTNGLELYNDGDLVLNNNPVANHSNQGINLYGVSNFELSGNTVTTSSLSQPVGGGIQLTANSAVPNIQCVNITKNTIENNHDYGIFVYYPGEHASGINCGAATITCGGTGDTNTYANNGGGNVDFNPGPPPSASCPSYIYTVH